MTLQSAGDLHADYPNRVPGKARDAQLYARLQLDDRLLLVERAAARHLSAATYASSPIRAQLECLAPLPKAELPALKHSVAELAVIGPTRVIDVGRPCWNCFQGKTPLITTRGC